MTTTVSSSATPRTTGSASAVRPHAGRDASAPRAGAGGGGWRERLARETHRGRSMPARSSAPARPRSRSRRRLGLAVEVDDALNEIDFGDWTGRGFEELRGRSALAAVERGARASTPAARRRDHARGAGPHRRRVSSASAPRLPGRGYRARQPRRPDQGGARSTSSACRSTRIARFEIGPASVS